MWLIIILFAIVVLTIAAAIQGLVLQIAFKIVTKDTPAFGDAFKTCFAAIIVNALLSYVFWQTEMESILAQAIGVCAGIIVYAIAISMFIATELKQAIVISLIMTGIWYMINFMFLGIVAGLNAPGAVGG